MQGQQDEEGERRTVWQSSLETPETIKRKHPESGSLYESSDIESIPSMEDIEVVDTLRRKVPSSPPSSPLSTKRSRNDPLTEQSHQTEMLTTLNNIEKKQNMILTILRDEAIKNKQERHQAKKDQDEIIRSIERLITIFNDCQNRIGVAETRILALQEIRKEKALQMFSNKPTNDSYRDTAHGYKDYGANKQQRNMK